jgi:alkylation response protein AidB-like acyl-CoA dehydrogenase
MARVQETYAHLTSRDPDYFWTSGQWMTEKKGGSDVSASTETIAIFDSSKNVYRLFGYKWFSSATDC